MKGVGEIETRLKMAGMNYFNQVQHSQLPQVIDPRQAMAIAACKGDAPSQVAMPNAISQAQIQQV